MQGRIPWADGTVQDRGGPAARNRKRSAPLGGSAQLDCIEQPQRRPGLASLTAIVYDPEAMFTGIVRHVGLVRSVTPTQGGARLTVDLGPLVEGLDL